MRATTPNITSRTNRRFFVLGACGILAITVIQVPKVVDLWGQVRSQRGARAELEAGISASERSARMDEQLASVRSELKRFEDSMVGAEAMPTVQSELMELARASGCQLRKAVVQAGSSETWESEKVVPSQEELEAELDNPAAIAPHQEENPYQLSSQQLSLSLTGTLTQTMDFLDRVRQRTWLMRVAQISFSRDADGQGQLNVEANLAFHKLLNQENAGRQGVPWREGSRASTLH